MDLGGDDIVYTTSRSGGMTQRWRHPHKEVDRALRSAEVAGFEVTMLKRGHTWGRVRSPGGQELAVWSTPRRAETMARRIREFVRRHGGGQ